MKEPTGGMAFACTATDPNGTAPGTAQNGEVSVSAAVDDGHHAPETNTDNTTHNILIRTPDRKVTARG